MQDKKMAVINFNDSLNNREQVHIALAHLISTIINVPTTWRNTLLALSVKISHSWELARFLIKIICQKQINPVVKLMLSHWWVKFVYHMKFCGQCYDNILQSNARRGVTFLRSCRGWDFVCICTHTYTCTNNPRNPHWIYFKIAFSGCHNIVFIHFIEKYKFAIAQQILFAKLMACWSNMLVWSVKTIA